MACGAFYPGRALAISARFFAMTTGTTDATVNALTLRFAKSTSTMVPFGVAETSQPLVTRPVPGPPHGIAKRPERYRLTPVCKTIALPTDHGIAEASQQCNRPTNVLLPTGHQILRPRRMVSP